MTFLAITLGIPPDEVERLCRAAARQGAAHGLTWGFLLGVLVCVLAYLCYRK